jgi:hypothetical protein
VTNAEGKDEVDVLFATLLTCNFIPHCFNALRVSVVADCAPLPHQFAGENGIL